ncbi:hypothetical protein BRC19_02460 [Candidatus Saccharibacteria bacterium QS_5_54_17]|nr:MAG: hypothetical protein BRC19_02460 [Candidatus Saccharibacteria bacterium QS_5_54_17]
MRDQAWLQQQLGEIWRLHFPDVQERNPVRIMFGRRAYRRLGSISTDPQDPEQTIIRVTGWFQYPQIPVEIVRSVIVHEMCHYAHGFHSGGAQQHTYPHAGGVIRREFAERDLEELYDRQQEWLREEWPKFLRKHYKGNYIKNPNKKGNKQ